MTPRSVWDRDGGDVPTPAAYEHAGSAPRGASLVGASLFSSGRGRLRGDMDRGTDEPLSSPSLPRIASRERGGVHVRTGRGQCGDPWLRGAEPHRYQQSIASRRRLLFPAADGHPVLGGARFGVTDMGPGVAHRPIACPAFAARGATVTPSDPEGAPGSSGRGAVARNVRRASPRHGPRDPPRGGPSHARSPSLAVAGPSRAWSPGGCNTHRRGASPGERPGDGNREGPR